MFEKAPTQSSDGQDTEKEGSVQIHTIPDVFYGGKNPAVYATPKIKKHAPPKKEVAPLEPTKETLAPPPTHHWLWIVLIAVGFVILLAIVWYYLTVAGIIGNKKVETPTPVVPVTVPVPPDPVPVPTPVPAPTSTPVQDPIVPTSSLTRTIDFPDIILADTNDLDFDGLTDEEEAVYGTDPGIWDTDEDGYFDGQEVANLYNPGGFAPVRIIDAERVQEYRNPIFGYKLYYPSNWAVAAVDNTADEVLLSAISGDYIAMYVREKESVGTLQDWIIDNAKGQFITDLRAYENKFDIVGFARRDTLVAYFEDTTNVYVLVYYPATGSDVSYRAVMNMVINSFRPKGEVSPLSKQPILPTATTTPVTQTSSSSSTTTSTQVVAS